MESRPDGPPLVEVREAVPAEPVPEGRRDPDVVPGPDPSCEPYVTAGPHEISPLRGLLGMREEQDDAGSGHLPHLGRPESLPTPVSSPPRWNHGAFPVRSSDGGIQLPHAGQVRAKWDTRLWQDGHRRVPGGSGGGGGGTAGHAPGTGANSGRGGGGGGKGEGAVGAPDGGGGGGRGNPPGKEGGIWVRRQRGQKRAPSSRAAPQCWHTDIVLGEDRTSLLVIDPAGASRPNVPSTGPLETYIIRRSPIPPLQDRRVGLVTRDPVLYGELAQFLRERRIPTVSLLPEDPIPRSVRLVLTSQEEARVVRHPRIVVARPGNLLAASAAVHDLLGGSRAPSSELVVGVDPGARPGYAVLGNGGRCLARGSLDSPEGISTMARSLRQGFPNVTLRFRVGNGDHIRRSRIVNSLLRTASPVELVDEQRTTVPGRRENDSLAALAIAATPGRPVHQQDTLRITRGDVANVQRQSRERSGGRFSIPRAMAWAVLEGRISLNDAVEATADRLGLVSTHRGGRAGRRAIPPFCSP